MRRLLLLAGLALALAALLLAQGAAGKKPPGRGSKVAVVSAVVPYIAPWRTGFERFSTQLYTPESSSFATLLMTVPAGQWWRIIYVQSSYQTSAVAGDRFIELRMHDANLNILFRAASPVPEPANAIFNYLYSPGFSTFTNIANLSNGSVVTAVPDVLWPPTTVIRLTSLGAQVGDAWLTQRVFAVEVYTPEKEGSPILVPMPRVP